MNPSNFPYPEAGAFIVQGCDAGAWLDSKWSAATFTEAQRIADERKNAQGGEWRVAFNRGAPKIQIVCRHQETGREVGRQQIPAHEADRADRIMIARNRAEVAIGAGYSRQAPSGYRWGIETEVQS